MINLSLNISWPWFKECPGLCRDYFYKAWRVTKNKTLEFQISYGSDTLIGASLYWSMRCDHAGIQLTLDFFRRFIHISFVDNRHWNDDAGRYVNYDNPEEVEKYW
jgi:hypothetical protein